MSTITVYHLDGDRFAISTRDHLITVDQPMSGGGTDTAPTPTELFIASLASCVGYYARRYLTRHGLPADGLTVTAAYGLASRPARVGEVRLDIGLPQGIPAERRDALLAVASHCTVHNTLVQPPEISITLHGDAAAA